VNIKIEDMYKGEDLSDRLSETEAKIYENIHDKLIQLGCICKNGRYYCKGKAKERVMIRFENDRGEDRGFVVTMRLPNLPNYSSNLDILSERVRECILHGQDCRPCSCVKLRNLETCGKGYAFTFQDQSYLKCHMVFENFKFYGLSEKDIPSLEKLLDNEVM